MRMLNAVLKRHDRSFLIKHCLLLLLVSSQITLFAKTPRNNHHSPNPYAFTVKGRVIDDKGDGLSGATVAQRGHTNTTSTAGDGSFSINIQQESAVLIISYVGYMTKEVPVRNATSDLVIQLSSNIASLDSVIIVGYGTTKRSVSTVAISSVKGEQLAAVPAANITNALAGRVTGILTRANGGRPGADNANIYVRGIATTGDASPLIVVDGVPRNNINE